MTAKEVKDAKGTYHGWQHKTTECAHRAAKLAVHDRVYQLLQAFIEGKEDSDMVFTTQKGEKVTHVSVELDMGSDSISLQQ